MERVGPSRFALRRALSGRLSSRAVLPTRRPLTLTLLGLRSHTSAGAGASKPPSNHANFYKTFGRPIAKVALMAIFTYQFAYYAWTRLELNEVKTDMTATIARLEARVQELEKSKNKT